MTTVVFAVGARPNFVKMAPVIEAIASPRALPPARRPHGPALRRAPVRRRSSTTSASRSPTASSASAPARTASRPASRSIAFERVLLEEPPDARRRQRRRQRDARLLAGGRQARHPRRPRRVRPALAATGPCRRSITASSPTGSRTSSSRTAPRRTRTSRAEGIAADRIHYVGNTMIDTLRRLERDARERQVWAALGVEERDYALVTLHRPSNVDDAERLRGDRRARCASSGRACRSSSRSTRARAPGSRAAAASTGSRRAGVSCLEPLGYLDFLSLQCRRGRDPDRLRRRPGGGLRARRPLLHAPRRIPSGRSRSPTGTNVLLGDDPAVIARPTARRGRRRPCADPAVGRPRRRARRRRPRRELRRDAIARRRDQRGESPPAAPSADRARPAARSTALTMDETVARCAELIQSGGPAQHVAINAAKIVSSATTTVCATIIERCELVSVDGQPVVWASRLLGDPLARARRRHRPDVPADGARGGARAIASTSSAPSRTCSRRRSRACATATRSLQRRGLPPRLLRRRGERPRSARSSASSEPHILLVAMSSPRKEYWLADHAADLGVPFSMGVGGSIDVVAGLTKRAPA